MVSPSLEAQSPSSSLNRRIRRADTVGRLRARHDGYVWLFGQIHVKHLLLFTHIALMIISLWLMWQVGVAEFDGLPVPGLDGFSPFRSPASISIRSDTGMGVDYFFSYVSTTPSIEKPYLHVSRNVSSALGYLFFFSTIMGFMVLMAMHGACRRGILASLFRVNPAFFLIPLLFCVVTLGGGFLLCCIRSFRMQLHAISERQSDQAAAFLIFDAIRFTFIPCTLMWIVYLYYLYGCVLSFLYVYRYSWDWSSLKRDIAATSTTSWSFKDRGSSLTRSSAHAITRNDRSPSVSAEEIDISFGPEIGGWVITERNVCDKEVDHCPLAICRLESACCPFTEASSNWSSAVMIRQTLSDRFPSHTKSAQRLKVFGEQLLKMTILSLVELDCSTFTKLACTRSGWRCVHQSVVLCFIELGKAKPHTTNKINSQETAIEIDARKANWAIFVI
ncbi:hypothetical protein KIN20_016637 [Parelaphostrongylus tenuis]|uniref:Uncharacterized protein n=1 Tax=Parelaphostrongylus tenuis TaxID=148309 RepID=A0AAD5MLW5_PARTN|nr:hypothetical protein KIN20_016637 [Parelaphostrongylus tenuis]